MGYRRVKSAHKKNPPSRLGWRIFDYYLSAVRRGLNRCLTMSYSHMGRPHTTIGAERFHCWVREGIRWFTLAMVVRQFGLPPDLGQRARSRENRLSVCCVLYTHVMFVYWLYRYHITGAFRPERFALRSRKWTCDYMVKPHEQLVLVSSTPRSAYTPSLSTSSSSTAL